jgi:hypothetical protein
VDTFTVICVDQFVDIIPVETPPRSVKFGVLQAQLSIVDLPPEGGPVASRSRPVMTPRRLAVLFPEKAIPDWVARPVQSSTAVQRARGEFLAFWGAEMRPLLCDVPMGVRTARSPSRPSSCGRTVVTQQRWLSRRCVPYRVGTRPASSVWYALTADLTGRPRGLRNFLE